VVFVSLLLAPALMATAALIGRRLGPSAAGWVVALPVSFAVAVVAVTLDAGARTASAMALSAGAHVPAQIAFAVVFAGALSRRGLLAGASGGTLAYVACGVALMDVPDALVLVGAVPALAFAPRLMPVGSPRPASQTRWQATALTCAVSCVIVGAAVLTSGVVGPHAAGAVLAFPTMSTTLAVVLVTRDGPLAGAHALAGLVRSLPCYLVFSVVIVLATPTLGLAAIGLAVATCVAAGRATWRGVPVTRQPAPAG
jgi:hypothetical protein